jgi:DNA helicase-2/ATP-dependent DNA helicase PcrA
MPPDAHASIASTGAAPANPSASPAADPLLTGLNPRQRQAATHASGALLIVAGPGSGKTRVMAHRVAWLVERAGIPPWRILAVTFTNKAARELRGRCERLVPGAADRLQVFTFHGFCARVLRQDGERAGLKPGFTIYDDDDQSRIIKRISDELQLDSKQFAPSALLNRISDAKNRMLGPEALAGKTETYRDEVVARVYVRYDAALRKANAADFDDLLLKVYGLLTSQPDVLARYQDRYQHLLVDEFQDTNPLQFQVARLLAGARQNICVVGDPDQSIYSWRHADPANLLEFLRVFKDATVITLDQSYRSTQTILSAADAVIANNTGRIEKNLWTENPAGDAISSAEAYDDDEEAGMVLDEVDRLIGKHGVDPRDIAVMYRVNALSRAMEVACNRRGVPYRLVGGLKFYDRAEIKDILAYLRLVSNPADDAAVERIINTPTRGISDRTLAALRTSALVSDSTLLDLVFSIHDGQGHDRLDLNTRALHAVSGFAAIIKRLIEQSLVLQPAELIDLALDRTGYLRHLQDDDEHGDERIENVRELRGTAEQFAVTSPGTDPRQNLAAFLENVALVSDVDDLDRAPSRRSSPLSATSSPLPLGEGDGKLDHATSPVGPTEPQRRGTSGQAPSPVHQPDERAQREPITLITLHQAKGLEFDTVFIIGLEEGLLPHSRSFEDAAQLQEERRICYVGMTRARRRLYLLHAFQRAFRGARMTSTSSRFLAEIPASLLSTKVIRNTGRRSAYVPDPETVRRIAATPAPRILGGPRPQFAAGDRVRHNLFGEGVIVSAKPVRDDTEVTVAFAGKGVKRLLLAFAPLEKIGASTRPAAGGQSAPSHDDT